MATVKIEEYTGVRHVMMAQIEIKEDGSEEWGAPERMAGLQAVNQTLNESSESRYYDNVAAIIEDVEGDDSYSFVVSVPALETRAKIEGRSYDKNTGALIGTPKKKPYFGVMFIGEKTGGVEELVVIYKGKFSGGAATRNTRTNSAGGTNLTYDYTSVYTTKKYTVGEEEKPVKNLVVPLTDELETLMETVFITPDKLKTAAASA